MNYDNKSITITYGDRAENHNGMQIIGEMAPNGFSPDDLEECQQKFESQGIKCTMIRLNDYIDGIDSGSDPRVLVIKQGVDHILKNIGKSAKDMFEELDDKPDGLKWDRKAYMYGRVVEKKARRNICIDDRSQRPDYENGKGTIVAFNKVVCCNEIRKSLPLFLYGSDRLIGEGNYYYNDTCGIGWHGDSERRKVVAIKLGDVKPINFQWYLKGARIGKMCRIDLDHGDIYVMSEKAVGTDWKQRNKPTLRHSTGADHFIA